MRICELFEARRNPQQNIKKSSIRDEALGYLSELDNVSYYGVTFTSTLKLGINPKTAYNTVAGIYFYPAEYYRSVKGKVPFASSSQYATIVKISGNILNITSITEDEVVRQFTKLENMLTELCDAAGKDYNLILKKYKEVKEKYSNSKFPGTALWQTVWQLSMALNGCKNKANIYTWNKILRDLGYDIVIDNGSGTIHPNEPTQGVALVPAAIKSIQSFEDPKHPSVKGNAIDYAPYDPRKANASAMDAMLLSNAIGSAWASRNQTPEFVKNIVADLNKASKNKKASAEILQYYTKVVDYAAMSAINNNYFKNISRNDIDLLYKFSSPAIKKKIEVAKST